MILSWNWLKKYVHLDVGPAEVAERLTMSGLNLESLSESSRDTVIDVDVTSNRPDCLGHIGVAREIAALFDQPLRIPEPHLTADGKPIKDVARVELHSPKLCSRYTARLIRGVKIGPSPIWMQDQLLTIGINPVNNVVDCTNYVMFECCQPLHAFDFSKLSGGTIVVREPIPGESLTAIDHKQYSLEPGMCVIADGEKPVAIGGVMGGAESEVSSSTKDVLIEAACFDPSSVRATARKLSLHSPSSYRFERGIDWQGIDWASRRCCELILQTAGGELASGGIDVHSPAVQRESIRLRFARLKQVLGIEVPRERVLQICQSLGLTLVATEPASALFDPPSWRRDLEREIDLVEEVGRVFGYEHVPDNVSVPMAASYKPVANRVLDKIRRALTGAGFDEAMTPSLTPLPWAEAFSPWTNQPPLVSNQPMLGVLEKASQNIGPVSYVRRSLIPNLLEAKRINEYRSNEDVELFEIAKIYLPQVTGIPLDPLVCALISCRSFEFVKGILEEIMRQANPKLELTAFPCEHEIFDISQSAELRLNGVRWGWMGRISPHGQKQFGLRQPAVAAELDLEILEKNAVLVPKHVDFSEFPPVTRDFNFVVSDDLAWARLENTVRAACGEFFELIRYRETFRDPNKDGPGRKRLLLSIVLRGREATLTGEQLDSIAQRIIGDCEQQLQAKVVA